MLAQLIHQKNHGRRPAAAACPARIWSAFTCEGVGRVAATQTCFAGGLGSQPAIADRSAGAVCETERRRAPVEELYAGPDLCWEKPCNFVGRKHGEEGKCALQKTFYLYR
jgi:hypothetical protein